MTMKITRGRLVLMAVALGAVALIWLASRPQPVAVDIAEATRGAMQVTIDEDGETRIRERYVVSAPLAGRLQRITLEPGDSVVAEETVVAAIEPRTPELIDPRSQAEMDARARAAEAALERARSQLAQGETDAGLAEKEQTRAERLFRTGAIARQEFESAEARAAATARAVDAAGSAVRVAEFELEQARAAARRADADAAQDPEGAFPLVSPIDGKVLRVLQESATVVSPGEPLVELGDPSDLEVWIDVLTTDAVAIDPGDDVIIDHWGGNRPLQARVVRIEPAAFTTTSALGVEEKRTWVVAEFTDAPDARAALGDNFRVEARVVTWRADDVLQVPVGALFRHGDGWGVFVVEGGAAELQPVEAGHRSGLAAEILGGLHPGQRVILHPGDAIAPGAPIEVREMEAAR